MPIEFKQLQQPTGRSDKNLFKLTMSYDGSGRRISKTSMRKVAGTADWATSYGENLFNQGVKITDEVRAKFHTDFQAEFPNGAKDDN